MRHCLQQCSGLQQQLVVDSSTGGGASGVGFNPTIVSRIWDAIVHLIGVQHIYTVMRLRQTWAASLQTACGAVHWHALAHSPVSHVCYAQRREATVQQCSVWNTYLGRSGIRDDRWPPLSRFLPSCSLSSIVHGCTRSGLELDAQRSGK